MAFTLKTMRHNRSFNIYVSDCVETDAGFPGNINFYKFGPIHQNININLINTNPARFGPGTYNLFKNNCQDYSEMIRNQF